MAALPSDRLTPETTSGREGYIHPAMFLGTTDHAEVRFILRDFEEALLESHVELLRNVAERVVAALRGQSSTST